MISSLIRKSARLNRMDMMLFQRFSIIPGKKRIGTNVRPEYPGYLSKFRVHEPIDET